MIKRRFQKDDAASEAVYSDCETYRYALTRVWDEQKPRLLYIMLNPSKATEQQNDPTIERCERRARALGFGAFCAVNIFALRETDPHQMRRHPAPEGADNAAEILRACQWADHIVAAWGVHGAHLGQGPRTKDFIHYAGFQLHHFGLTKGGHPRHPLYVPYAQKPELWPQEG
ncbi:DUF1643 domain-containing protein [Cognatishimia maritima]|uniref:DUF1643 domain-containing protein n=1 Tax=Cognatishimia maritima TaxID=870908 RepID=A0A1M5SVP6_9RHOB|nr:DUF1643 domain-containing protein [Cognatishimia maritima]SHH42567.1 hypothetical protein SAMN04488044_2509 [Cognatishimia maritima]